ncbi:hypothetical protein ACFQ2T_05660 [Methylophilus flavus]|uniref:Uncharacterized protein n=1 Tax=Methylophilus flavus TaxID=640084 RepID=A0ABW3PDM7_9PROT
MKRILLLVSMVINMLIFNSSAMAEPANKPTTLSLPFKSNSQWMLELPNDGPVVYHGVYSLDEAGTGKGGMLYPAPSAAGLVAAIVTHALIINSVKNEQKNQLQLNADQVLSSYQEALNHFKYGELIERTIDRLSLTPAAEHLKALAYSERRMIIESAPTFMLTQDQKTIIINDNVVIRIPGQTPEVAHKSMIRVISAAENSADSSSFWTGNQGENIKGISSQLHAQSIDIALQTFAAGKSAESKPFQTVRYKEGLSDKVERAQVIHKDCDRMLIKNLRGVFISAPVVKSPENACEPVTEI